MLLVKNNYKNSQQSLACRACQNEAAIQEHAKGDCITIHNDDSKSIVNTDIFPEEPLKLAKTGNKITAVMMMNELSDPDDIEIHIVW